MSSTPYIVCGGPQISDLFFDALTIPPQALQIAPLLLGIALQAPLGGPQFLELGSLQLHLQLEGFFLGSELSDARFLFGEDVLVAGVCLGELVFHLGTLFVELIDVGGPLLKMFFVCCVLSLTSNIVSGAWSSSTANAPARCIDEPGCHPEFDLGADSVDILVRIAADQQFRAVYARQPTAASAVIPHLTANAHGVDTVLTVWVLVTSKGVDVGDAVGICKWVGVL